MHVQTFLRVQRHEICFESTFVLGGLANWKVLLSLHILQCASLGPWIVLSNASLYYCFYQSLYNEMLHVFLFTIVYYCIVQSSRNIFLDINFDII